MSHVKKVGFIRKVEIPSCYQLEVHKFVYVLASALTIFTSPMSLIPKVLRHVHSASHCKYIYRKVSSLFDLIASE